MTNALDSKPKNKVFNIMLVDIKNTWEHKTVTCIKKNMYEKRLKYIALSYRWGELEEQLVPTPDYIANITSFYLGTFINLCYFITQEPDLKEIPFLWIDAISMEQQYHNDTTKWEEGEAGFEMTDLFLKASSILVVPDLHRCYLEENSIKRGIINLIWKYRNIIHASILNQIKNSESDYNNSQHHYSKSKKKKKKVVKTSSKLKKEMNDPVVVEINDGESKLVYPFLAYLIDDWYDHDWIINKFHQIGKDKDKSHKIQLKYIFLSLLYNNTSLSEKPFFSYNFVKDQENSKDVNMSMDVNSIMYDQVDNDSKLIHFLNSRFIYLSRG